MRIYECWFCGGPCYPGHGMTFVRNDAKVIRFCQSKCRTNYKLRRNPRKVKWTKAYRRTHGKEMTVDSTLDFVKKRNRPLKYNRARMELALRAIKRIHEIKARREKLFYENRMKMKRATELADARKDLAQNISLIEAPESLRSKQPVEIKAKFANANKEFAQETARRTGNVAKRARLMEY